MQLKNRLNLLFTYAIRLVLLAVLTAIFAIGLFKTSNIVAALFSLLYALIFGLLAPGFIIVWELKHFFSLVFNRELKLFIQIMTPIVPWIILGLSIRANNKKWIVFVGLFILMYTLYGAFYFVLELIE